MYKILTGLLLIGSIALLTFGNTMEAIWVMLLIIALVLQEIADKK